MATSTKTVRVELTGDPSSLERSLTVVSEKSAQTASKMEGHASRIGGAFRGLDNQLGQFGIPFTGALSEIGNKFDEMETHGEGAFKKISAAGGLALAALGVAAVGIGIEGVHLADQFEKAHSNLETAVKNSGGSMKEIQPYVDAQTSSFAKLGYNATAYEGALGAATLATGDSHKALGLMSHAADLAAFSHTTLEKASIALSKAMEGNLRPLKQLGIDLPIQGANAVQVAKAHDTLVKALESAQHVQDKINDGRLKGVAASDALKGATDKVAAAQQALSDKQNAGAEIYDAVNKKTEGAAEKAAETFQGKIKALEAQLENLGIKIGQFLIPIIEDLVSAISDVIDWFEKHQAAAIALAGVIATVLGGAIAIFVYDKVASFVGGIQRMISGLTALMTKSSETAAAVEADGAVIAESQAGAGAAAAGGGVVAGEGAAAGGAAIGGEEAAGGMAAAGAAGTEGATGLAAFGAAAAAVAVPVALLAGTAYGLSQTFGDSDGWSVKLNFDLGNMATQTVPQLSEKFQHLADGGRVMNQVLDDNKASTLATKTMHEDFNKVLDQSPQYAQKFIDAVQGAGGSTAWYSQKLQEHVLASELARNAQERFSIQAEITDAKARGDAAAVYELTARLNAVPTDVQTYLAVNAGNALSTAQEILDTLNALPPEINIAVNMTGNLAASGISSVPF